MVNAGEWLDEAQDDLKAAENLGKARLYAAACFHCQQAAEKALKALLISRKNQLAKSHSLRELADRAGCWPRQGS
ncbi:MAG: HEPN domain-containing protein [Candidatus Micrarchaeota archaeon]